MEEKIIQEVLNIADPDDRLKLKKRAQSVSRTAQLARTTAKKAEEKNDADKAEKLKKKADELEALLKNINVDTIEDEEENSQQQDSSDSNNSQKNNSSEDENKPEFEDDENDEEDEEESNDFDDEENEKEDSDIDTSFDQDIDGEQKDNSGNNKDSDVENDNSNKDDNSDQNNESPDNSTNLPNIEDLEFDKPTVDTNTNLANNLQDQIDNIQNGYNNQLSDKQKEQLENLKNKLDDLKEQAKQAGDDEKKQIDIFDKLDRISEKLDNLEDKLSDDDEDYDYDDPDNLDGDDSEEDDSSNENSKSDNNDSKNDNSSDDDVEDADFGSSSLEDESSEDDSKDNSIDDQEGNEESNDSNRGESKDMNSEDDGSDGDESEDDNEDKDSSNDSEGTSDGSDQDEQESDSDIEAIENPFADEEDEPDIPPMGMGGKPPREAGLEDIIKMLKDLKGEEKRGALDGLQAVLQVKDDRQTEIADEETNESLKILHEAKNLRTMTDDEFGDLINGVIDLIDDVNEVEDIEDRKAKINQMINDKNTIDALRREDNVNVKKSYQATKANSNENNRYGNFPTIKSFELDFYDAIKDQVDRVKQNLRTYDEINNEYESENILMKADVIKEIDDEDKPTIDFYFDMSGSWTWDKRAMDVGKQAVATVKEFEDRDEIKLNIYYFSDADYDGFATSANDSKLGRGTRSWNAILQNIKATDTKNVVIMTDSDMNWEAIELGETCIVDGCVWFIWHGNCAEGLPKHLKGLSGTSQYQFN